MTARVIEKVDIFGREHVAIDLCASLGFISEEGVRADDGEMRSEKAGVIKPCQNSGGDIGNTAEPQGAVDTAPNAVASVPGF